MDEPPESHRRLVPNLKDTQGGSLNIRFSKSVEPKTSLKKLKTSNRFGSMSMSGSSSLDSIQIEEQGLHSEGQPDRGAFEEHHRN